MLYFFPFPFGFYAYIEFPFTLLFLGLGMVFLDLLWRVEQKDASYVKEVSIFWLLARIVCVKSTSLFCFLYNKSYVVTTFRL